MPSRLLSIVISPGLHLPLAAPEVLVDDVGLGEPAHADVLVAVGGDDPLRAWHKDVLGHDRDVAKEEVGVGVERRVGLLLEALRALAGDSWLEGVAAVSLCANILAGLLLPLPTKSHVCRLLSPISCFLPTASSRRQGSPAASASMASVSSP